MGLIDARDAGGVVQGGPREREKAFSLSLEPSPLSFSGRLPRNAALWFA